MISAARREASRANGRRRGPPAAAVQLGRTTPRRRNPMRAISPNEPKPSPAKTLAQPKQDVVLAKRTQARDAYPHNSHRASRFFGAVAWRRSTKGCKIIVNFPVVYNGA